MCEDLTALGDATISGNSTNLAKFTAKMNRRNQLILTSLFDAQDDWDFDDSNNTDYAIATAPLVANQRDYSFPASLKILRMTRVDVTYDGTNWYRATEVDSRDFSEGLGNDTVVDGRFSKSSPSYDLKANALMLYPRATQAEVDAGAKVRIEFARSQSDFATSDTTKTPGFDAPFHPMLAIGAALDYAIENDLVTKIQTLAAQWTDWEARLKTYYSRKGGDAAYRMDAATVSYT